MKAAAPEEADVLAEVVPEAAESESESASDVSELESEVVAVGLPVETVLLPPLVAVAKPLLPVAPVAPVAPVPPTMGTLLLTTGAITDVPPAGSVTAVGWSVTTVGWVVTTDGWPVTTPSELVRGRKDVNGLVW